MHGGLADVAVRAPVDRGGLQVEFYLLFGTDSKEFFDGFERDDSHPLAKY